MTKFQKFKKSLLYKKFSKKELSNPFRNSISFSFNVFRYLKYFCILLCFSLKRKNKNNNKLFFATLLKSNFGMCVFLWIFCIFSEQLFLKTPLEDCFYLILFSQETKRRNIETNVYYKFRNNHLWDVLWKKLLLKILQNSQENTCKFCEIFKNPFFLKYLLATGSPSFLYCLKRWRTILQK